MIRIVFDEKKRTFLKKIFLRPFLWTFENCVEKFFWRNSGAELVLQNSNMKLCETLSAEPFWFFVEIGSVQNHAGETSSDIFWKSFVRNHYTEPFCVLFWEESGMKHFLENLKRIFPCVRRKNLFKFDKKNLFFRVWTESVYSTGLFADEHITTTLHARTIRWTIHY